MEARGRGGRGGLDDSRDMAISSSSGDRDRRDRAGDTPRGSKPRAFRRGGRSGDGSSCITVGLLPKRPAKKPFLGGAWTAGRSTSARLPGEPGERLRARLEGVPGERTIS